LFVNKVTVEMRTWLFAFMQGYMVAVSMTQLQLLTNVKCTCTHVLGKILYHSVLGKINKNSDMWQCAC